MEGDPQRLNTLTMSIHTGMLESLGLNMYSTVAKCLVEFVANAYDSDADRVEISIPFDRIRAARDAARVEAKKDVAENRRDAFTVLTDPLPDDIEVVIRDDGHGMTPQDLQDRFLALNRNRRVADKSPLTAVKKRYVMGRKGLGKLAGFGAAQLITVRTKREGQSYVTQFVMDYNKIRELATISEASFDPSYEEGADKAEHFTEIRLARLRCDSMKQEPETVLSTLQRNFALLEDTDFEIKLNGETVKAPAVTYDFKFPGNEQCDASGFATHTVKVDGSDLSFPIKYRVMFRPRAGESGGQQSLPAAHRGARVYCNKRLAKGPSLLKLHSGMHNFHSQSYMECVVHADDLDRSEVDHISTNRADFRSDNEVIEALDNDVTEIMRLALAAHAKHIETKDDEQLAREEFTKNILKTAAFQSEEAEGATRKLLKTLAKQDGVSSPFFREAAGQIISTMNASEVLVRLTELGVNPQSVPQLAHELAELRLIEHKDALKLYRARLDAIRGLDKLYMRSIDDKGQGFESELHDLLKENPWLINMSYSHALTSDKDMGHVAKQLDKVLGIDTGLPEDYKPEAGDETRPDLVFVAQMGVEPIQTIVVVELKSPGITLNADHKTQLVGYMAKIKNHLGTDAGNSRILGYLIGTPPDKTAKSDKQQALLHEMESQGLYSEWQVLSIQKMLAVAKRSHLAVSEAISKDKERLDEDLR